MSRFLRIPFVLNHLSRRFQQTQAKLATKIKIKQPYQPLGCLAGGPVFRNAKLFPDRVAVRDKIAAYTYGNVFMSAYQLSKEITNLLDCKSHEKVLFLCPNDVQYVITLWAIWMSGQLAVPVSPLHPKGLLLYYTNDCSAKLIITVPEFSDLMRIISKNCGTRLHVLDDKLKLNCTLMQASQPSDLEGGRDDIFYNKSDAMILYTSGTTANPKGVVLSYKNLSTQASALLDAWKWSSDDVILHTLPLHHIHGIVNALLCPLYAGAKIMMLNRFHANTVWSYLLGVNARPDDRRITVFMGVPTMYSKLIQEYERVFKKDPKMAEYIKNTLKTKVRLTVTGSAPLSEPLFKEWEEITGHRLLERYGMTETGMTLSNVYDSDREPGFVGVPLPGVSTKIIEVKDGPNFGKTLVECTNVDGTVVYQKNGQKMADGQNPTGELFVKGEGVFMRYHQRPDTTKEVFTQDGWFKTGDISQFSVEKKVFKILGRKNIDIIKSGGFKVSALEIESALLGHPSIRDCVVFGLEDPKLGQKIFAIVTLKETEFKGKKVPVEVSVTSMLRWMEDRVPKYAVPREIRFVDSIPKNSMGKVNKKELFQKAFGPQY